VFVAAAPDVTEEEYLLGKHYEYAEDEIKAGGFCGPVVMFDEVEMPDFLLWAWLDGAMLGEKMSREEWLDRTRAPFLDS
jgi:hypothetical protein